MPNFTLDDRTRLSVELALTAESNDMLRRKCQEEDARSLGMTGAEVDAARRGTSFDARTSLVVAFAAAQRRGDIGTTDVLRERMRRAGIGSEIFSQIEEIVRNGDSAP